MVPAGNKAERLSSVNHTTKTTHHHHHNQDLKCIKNDPSKLRENVFKIQAEVAAAKQVNKILGNQMVQFERSSWSYE